MCNDREQVGHNCHIEPKKQKVFIFTVKQLQHFSRQPRIIVKSVLSGCLRHDRNIHAKFQVYRSVSFEDINKKKINKYQENPHCNESKEPNLALDLIVTKL